MNKQTNPNKLLVYSNIQYRGQPKLKPKTFKTATQWKFYMQSKKHLPSY